MTTQISPVTSPRVEKFFARVARGRLIFALDATASREPTWDTASKLQSDMFTAAGGLDVQLCYYRGGECVASRWLQDARSLASIMSAVMCRAGITQIKRVLEHARKEHQCEKVNALLIVSDACEENEHELYDAARGLRDVPVFMFQEGTIEGVATVYREIAKITGGALASFDAGAADRLRDLLKAVAAYASGGMKALQNQNSEAARLLLTQMKK